jgi:hypothetical protein
LVPGGCRGPRGVAGFLGAGRAAGVVVRGRAWAGRAASSGAVWFPAARRLARWPSPRRPVTSAAAWWPVACGWCSRSGPSQCPAPHREVYAGSVTITCRPALAAIWTSRSRNLAVGMPATARRNPRPLLPREGRLPWRSRPSARAPAKSRSSITTAWAPCSFAVAMRLLIAARSRPSRVAEGSPARSSGMAAGVPRTLPSAATTATARCPTLTSTATTGCRRSSHRDAAGAGAAFQDASMYQRPRTGSQAMS